VAAGLGVVLSTYPVIFSGASFLSPGNGGVFLLYDTQPTLPHDHASIQLEHTHGADVGAMMWQHFVYTVIEERAIKRDHEFPLWNRYNGAGRSLIGQGQAMLGDPFNWLIMVFGTSAAAYDVKFVVLKLIFALSIGATVFLLTRSLRAAALSTVFAPFITYFVYRVNHPAIFSLCYAPLILLAWIGIARSDRSRLHLWLALLAAANWLLINSGTVKEAYIGGAVLNILGALAVPFNSESGKAKNILVRLCAGIVTVALTCVVALPVLGSLYDAISKDASFYQVPHARFVDPSYLIGFADNLFFLITTGAYWPGINMAVAFGLGVGALGLLRGKELLGGERNVAALLFAGWAACLAIAAGLLPENVVVLIPILKNVHHIHNTFLTAAIVPACVLSGIGFATWMRTPKDVRAKYGGILAVLFVAFVVLAVSAAQSDLRSTLVALVYATVGIWATWLYSKTLLPHGNQIAWTAPVVGMLAVALMILLGHGAMWGKGGRGIFSSMVLNPSVRMDLLATPSAVSNISRRETDPVRVMGLGNAMLSGYRAALGFESIDGPDAFQSKAYRELVVAMAMSFDGYWPIVFTRQNLAMHAGALDMLGVGIVFSGVPLHSTGGLSEVFSEDRLSAYRRPGVWPRAFFTNRIFAYGSIKELAAEIERRPGPFVGIPEQQIERNPDLRQFVRESDFRAHIIPGVRYKLTSNSTSFSIDAPSAGVVYLGEADEPGDFQVTVNGVETSYFAANHAFKAIVLPARGHYDVSVRYWPAKLNTYLLMAAGGLTGLIILIVWVRRAAGAPPRDSHARG